MYLSQTNHRHVFLSPFPMQVQPQTTNLPSQFSPWFDNIVSELRAHEIQLETETAPKEMQDFYKSFVTGDMATAMQMSREVSAQFFVRNLIGDFFKELIKSENGFVSISISYSDSEVRVWAVLKDNDVKSEDNLFMAEAVINSKYYQYGFHLSLTIVEESDNIKVPPHFETVVNRGKISRTHLASETKSTVSSRSKRNA